MNRPVRMISAQLITMLLVACGGVVEDGEWSVWNDRLEIPEQDGLLDFVNDQEHTTYWLLDEDCGLRSDSARHLIRHRDGKDSIDGTADDDLFDSIQEVDDVHMVGPVTMSKLFSCAKKRGYISEAPQCEFTEEYTARTDQLAPELATLVNGSLRRIASSRRDVTVKFPVMFAEAVTFSRCDEAESYEVHYRQWIDPEGGIQLWFAITLDASYTVTHIETDI